MLTSCPKCHILHHRCTEDACSPNDEDRMCARCFRIGEIKKGRMTFEDANSNLEAVCKYLEIHYVPIAKADL